MSSPEPEYRLIPLTQGQFAKVSPHRFEQLGRYRWCALWSPCTKSFYAVRTSNKKNIYMHRVVLGLDYGDKRTGDHINFDTLDNQDGNLRIATRAENNRHVRLSVANKSGFKGVYKTPRRNSWTATIRVDGKNIRLGSRKSAEAAYRDLYVPAATKHHGEFAHVE